MQPKTGQLASTRATVGVVGASAAASATSAITSVVNVLAATALADTPVRPNSTAAPQSRNAHTGHVANDNPRKLRGIFFHDSRRPTPEHEASASASDSSPAPHRRADFRQWLDQLLMSEEQAQAVGRQLYRHFEGDIMSQLPALQHLLQERWSFPARVFPMLVTLIRRVSGGSGSDPKAVTEDDWTQAFVRWLQVLKTRCGKTKVTRQRLIQKHDKDEDLAKSYFMGARLGAGSFGEVSLAIHTSLGARRVVKSIAKTQLSVVGEEQVEAEVSTLSNLDHPHIVRIFEAFETEDRLHIVMDYAEGGDLSEAIRQASEEGRALPEGWSRTAAWQIVCALGYMHSKGVIHCDLKPGNTMLLQPFNLKDAEAGRASPHVLVVDFGLAEIFDERTGRTQVKGSPTYLAPEGFEGKLSKSSDMWALGVMIYEMLTGMRPFRGTNNLFTLFCQVANTEPSMEGLPPAALELISALLLKDPKARPGAAECGAFRWFAEAGPARKRAPPALPHDLLFGHVSYFHRAVMFCIAAGLGLKDIGGLCEAFAYMDQNLTGTLTVDELRRGLKELGIRQDPNALMTLLDLDQDGQVSYTEFMAGALRLDPSNAERQLRYAFESFDEDGDGYITIRELRAMLSGEEGLEELLPDGRTVEQVMEDITGGEDRMSFAAFRDYLLQPARRTEDLAVLSPGAAAEAMDAFPCWSDGGCEDIGEAPPEERAAALVEDLLGGLGPHGKTEKGFVSEGNNTRNGGSQSGLPTEEEPFPSFHDWLEELFNTTQEGADFSRLLMFPKTQDEANYVAHHLPNTCLQMALLTFVLAAYSVWVLLTEDFAWDPVLAHWDLAPRITYNITWLVLLVAALGACASCIRRVRMTPGEAVQTALTFELRLCVFGCAVPWVSCFLANRFRVASLFNENPDDVFTKMNSDYDLILVMLASLMFLSTRTYLRFVSALPIAASCVLAYGISSAILGTPYTSCQKSKNWAWPAVLLVSISVLALTGHRAVERQRRLTFLSLQASYNVLSELHDSPGSPAPKDGQRWPETRTARLKLALDLTRRLSASPDMGNLGNRALRKALASLVEVLEETRADVAQIDRLTVMDPHGTLLEAGVSGPAMDLLLVLLDAPPCPPAKSSSSKRGASTVPGLPLWALAPGAGGAGPGSTPPLEAWGWDVLVPDHRPLAVGSQAAELLLNTAAAAAAAEAHDPSEAEAARRAAGRFLAHLLKAYAAGHPAAEARAALAMLSAQWLARVLGLWGPTRPWDRVALLAAAAGLHCEAADWAGAPGGAMLASDPLLGASASVTRTLEALEKSGLVACAAGASRDAGALRRSVRRLMSRGRPRCALEDALRVRIRLDEDDQALWAERTTVSTLTLAAGDLAILALPPSMRRPWEELCESEAADVVAGRAVPSGALLGWAGGLPTQAAMEGKLDAFQWLRGCTEVLALPIFETLARFDGSEKGLAVPLRHLRQNSKHWKALVTPTAFVAPAPVEEVLEQAAIEPDRQTAALEAALVGGWCSEQQSMVQDCKTMPLEEALAEDCLEKGGTGPGPGPDPEQRPATGPPTAPPTARTEPEPIMSARALTASMYTPSATGFLMGSVDGGIAVLQDAFEGTVREDYKTMALPPSARSARSARSAPADSLPGQVPSGGADDCGSEEWV